MNAHVFHLTGEEKQEPLLYKGCGLEGIYLLNGYEIEEHDGDLHIAVKDIDGLHREIGRHIVTSRKGLSKAEIRFLRNTMGCTQAELAKLLGNTSQSVARWEKGECDIPGASEKLLRVIFLASLLSEGELKSLQELALKRLEDLDDLDEVGARPAQFRLFEAWQEKAA